MNTNFFGRSAWVVLHVGMDLIVQDGWPADRVEHEFLNCVNNVLCCLYCRNGFTHFRKVLPFPKTKDSSEWPAWVVRLHNLVNQKLKKPQYEFSKHPFHSSLLLPSLLDLLYSAALNIPTQNVQDRLHAFCCFVPIAIDLVCLQRHKHKIQRLQTIWKQQHETQCLTQSSTFDHLYDFIHTHIVAQRLTKDQIRSAYEVRRARKTL